MSFVYFKLAYVYGVIIPQMYLLEHSNNHILHLDIL